MSRELLWEGTRNLRLGGIVISHSRWSQPVGHLLSLFTRSIITYGVLVALVSYFRGSDLNISLSVFPSCEIWQ